MPTSKTRLRSRTRSKSRTSSSRTRSKTRSSHHRSSAAATAAAPKQPLEDQLMAGLLRSGVPKENATIIASLILSVVGTYDDNPKVAEKAQEAAEEVVDSIETADAKKVRAALTKAGAAAAAALAEQRDGKQRGGVRWDRPLPAGYTTATAGLAALAFGTVQLIKHILQKNNCDSRVINVACLMIPCLMHALPELLAPGAVPGLAYVPVEAQAPHED